MSSDPTFIAPPPEPPRPPARFDVNMHSSTAILASPELMSVWLVSILIAPPSSEAVLPENADFRIVTFPASDSEMRTAPPSPVALLLENSLATIEMVEFDDEAMSIAPPQQSPECTRGRSTPVLLTKTDERTSKEEQPSPETSLLKEARKKEPFTKSRNSQLSTRTMLPLPSASGVDSTSGATSVKFDITSEKLMESSTNAFAPPLVSIRKPPDGADLVTRHERMSTGGGGGDGGGGEGGGGDGGGGDGGGGEVGGGGDAGGGGDRGGGEAGGGGDFNGGGGKRRIGEGDGGRRGLFLFLLLFLLSSAFRRIR